MIIAIDGPSGAGKSSVAKCIARKLGFSCLDTGAMYRTIALTALNRGIDLNDEDALEKLCGEVEISFGKANADGGPSLVFANGEDVTSEIRTAEIDKAVSPVSAAQKVRAALVDQQRRIGECGNYVVEGRDIASVVFPNAELKIFLTASPEERAHRRVRQNVDRGCGSIDYQEVLEDIKRRDHVDSTREESPLVIAEGAIVIDSSGEHIEDVIDQICNLAKEKM